MEGLILELDKERRENDCLEDNNMNLKIMVKKFQGEAVIYEQEKEEMTVMIRERTGQIHKLEMQMEGAEGQLGDMRDLQIQCT